MATTLGAVMNLSFLVQERFLSSSFEEICLKILESSKVSWEAIW